MKTKFYILENITELSQTEGFKTYLSEMLQPLSGKCAFKTVDDVYCLTVTLMEGDSFTPFENMREVEINSGDWIYWFSVPYRFKIKISRDGDRLEAAEIINFKLGKAYHSFQDGRFVWRGLGRTPAEIKETLKKELSMTNNSFWHNSKEFKLSFEY